MNRTGEFLATHWLAAALAVEAVLLFARFRRKRTVALTTLGTLGFFALGGFAITNVPVDLFGRYDLGSVLFSVGLGSLIVAFSVLILGRVWSPHFAAVAFAVTLFGLGGWCEAALGEAFAELARMTRSVQCTRPIWLALLAFVPWVVVVARRSLSGLGTTRKWVAIGARCIIVALLACALAEPRVNRPSENITVLFLLDRSQSIPQDIEPGANIADQVDRRWQRTRGFVRDAVLLRGVDHSRDKSGAILFGKRPKLALPPASVRDRFDVDDRMAGPIDGQYTDIAAALKLALASFPEGTGKRVVLVSDGNENVGNAVDQAALAKQNGVQIDVVAVAPGYKNENEVLVHSVEAPPVTTTGTQLPLRVLLRNTSSTRVVRGVLELLRVGLNADGSEKIEQVAIENDQPQVLDAPMGKPATVVLQPGLNALRYRDVPPKPGETS